MLWIHLMACYQSVHCTPEEQHLLHADYYYDSTHVQYIIQPATRAIARQQHLLEASQDQQQLLLGLREKEESKDLEPFSRLRTATM